MGDRFTIDEFSRQFASPAPAPMPPPTLFQRLFRCFTKPPLEKPQTQSRRNLHERRRFFVRAIYK
jgi:hypothetical protein